MKYNILCKIASSIANEYCNLTKKHRKKLYNEHSIDCGTDYARFLLDSIIVDAEGKYIW